MSIHKKTRKTHRYLGLFIGIQFLFWTIGGLYFSWNNMYDVHGKTLIDKSEKSVAFQFNEPTRKLLSTVKFPIEKLEGIIVANDTLLRVSGENETKLLRLNTNQYSVFDALTKDEVSRFVSSRLKESIEIKSIVLLTEKDVGKHHEYRSGDLPAYAVSLEHDTNTIVYVHSSTAKITKVRNDNWRRFDFLWMLHVMDFESRDQITNWMLRIFSGLGLATILSGFYLYYLSSPTIRRIKKRTSKK